MQPQAERVPLGGPYVPAETAAAETTYLPNPRYFAAVATQPQEIVQRRFADAAAAAAALRRGQIDVVDRLAPWQVKSLAADADLVVQSYALPRLHCLIPNLRRPLTASRTFRRALACGIDRPAILAELLWGDRRPGCTVLHGPFPQGDSAEDPLGYAADPELEALALRSAAGPGAGRGRASRGGRGLAGGAAAARPGAGFSQGEIARTACAAIRRQLAAIDVAVELKELDPTTAAGAVAEVDLLYVELALWEPVVDAPRLLGAEGLTRGCSAPMSQALGELAAATRWTDAVACLHRIDRVAHDEVAVVPLWQLRDCFAYRKGFAGDQGQDVEPVSRRRALEARLLLPDGQVRTRPCAAASISIFLLAWACRRHPRWRPTRRMRPAGRSGSCARTACRCWSAWPGGPNCPRRCRPPWPDRLAEADPRAGRRGLGRNRRAGAGGVASGDGRRAGKRHRHRAAGQIRREPTSSCSCWSRLRRTATRWRPASSTWPRGCGARRWCGRSASWGNSPTSRSPRSCGPLPPWPG